MTFDEMVEAAARELDALLLNSSESDFTRPARDMALKALARAALLAVLPSARTEERERCDQAAAAAIDDLLQQHFAAAIQHDKPQSLRRHEVAVTDFSRAADAVKAAIRALTDSEET